MLRQKGRGRIKTNSRRYGDWLVGAGVGMAWDNDQNAMNMVLPEFSWMAEKTTVLARASCSTKEHIRAIDDSAPAENASNLHAGPCQAEMAEIEVAQNALCSTAPPGLASLGRESVLIDVHPSKFRKNLK